MMTSKMIPALVALSLSTPVMAQELNPIQKLTLLGDAYRYLCESQGGEYVNDNPSFIQAWSCYLPEGTWVIPPLGPRDGQAEEA
jgi:hypothetical protein